MRQSNDTQNQILYTSNLQHNGNVLWYWKKKASEKGDAKKQEKRQQEANDAREIPSKYKDLFTVQ